MMKKVILLILLILNSTIINLHSQTVRSVKDSIGFCWNAEEMNHFINWLDKNCYTGNFDSKDMIGAISVHDDYLYAGKVYYPLYKNIRTKEVLIFGVTHGTIRKELGTIKNVLILDEYDEWKGTYSNVKISPLRELLKNGLDKEDFIVSNRAHSIEHSIEALIPFLQYYNREVKITPVMVTQLSPDKTEKISSTMSKIITNYILANNLIPGKDIFFLISNDANHYGEDFKNAPWGMNLEAHDLATKNDKKIIAENLTGDLTASKIHTLENEILPDSNSSKQIPLWCGRFPISLGLRTIKKIVEFSSKHKLTGELFKYSDSLTEKVLPIENTSMGLTAIFSTKHWCGWFTLGLYLR